MSRVVIDLPEKIHFETILKLRIYDMNYGGHLGNDSVLSVMHEARVQFLSSLNLSEKDFYGHGLLMVDSAILYKKQGFYGDSIQIKMSISELSKYGFEITYLIINTISEQEITRAKTGLVCYNYNLNELYFLPNQFKVLFSD